MRPSGRDYNDPEDESEQARRRRQELGVGAKGGGLRMGTLFACTCTLFGKTFSCFERDSSSQDPRVGERPMQKAPTGAARGAWLDSGVDPVEARLRDWQSETKRRAAAARGSRPLAQDPLLDDLGDPLFTGTDSWSHSLPRHGPGARPATPFRPRQDTDSYGSGGGSSRGRTTSPGRGGSRPGTPGPGRSTSPWREGGRSPLPESPRRSVKFDLPPGPPPGDDDGTRTPRRPVPVYGPGGPQRPPQERERIRRALVETAVGRRLPEAALLALADCASIDCRGSGATIVQQGEEGERWYVIEAGVCDVLQAPRGPASGSLSPRPPARVGELRPGDAFGELALLQGRPRAATVVARTDVRLLAFDAAAFRRLVGPPMQAQRDAFGPTLDRAPLLRGLHRYERVSLADGMEEQRFGPGEAVVLQGDPAEAFYFVLEGELACSQVPPGSPASRARLVGRLGPGDFFGELALMSRQPRLATVSTTTAVRVAALPRDLFLSRLLPLVHHELLQHAAAYASLIEIRLPSATQSWRPTSSRNGPPGAGASGRATPPSTPRLANGYR